MKKIILFLLCLSGTVSVMAQITKIEFTPPSSASLMKETDYPVNSSNGVPEIKIPLQSMFSGDLVMNLSLDFNIDSYIQPNQLPDSPGAGWSLNSDIQISRQIRGEDDFGTYGYLKNTSIPSGYGINDVITRSQEYKSAFYVDKYDEEPDKFYYRLLDKCGVFYFRKSSDGSVLPVCVPTDGTKVTYHEANNRQVFLITDTNGTTYEYTSDYTDHEEISGEVHVVPQAWKCTKITNAARTDSITFTYLQVRPNPIYGYSPTGIDLYDSYQTSEIPQDITPPINNAAMRTTPVFVNCPYGPAPSPGSPDPVPPSEGSITAPSLCTIVNPKYSYNTIKPGLNNGDSKFYIYDGRRYDQFFMYVHPESQNVAQSKTYLHHYPSEIKFRSGSIRFDYASSGALEQITILDISSATEKAVKTIRLTQQYASPPSQEVENQTWISGSRYLESLDINGEIYTFSYSGYHNCGVITDFWGYELDPVQSFGYTFVPQHSVSVDLGASSSFCSSRQSTSLTIGSPLPIMGNSQPKALLSITYPTGGCVKFFTERHRYKDENNIIRPVGGDRIARIEWYDNPSGSAVRQKIYRYGDQEDGCGILKLPLDFSDLSGNCHTTQYLKYYRAPSSAHPTQYAMFGSERKRSYLPSPTYTAECGSGSWVRYSHVAEYDTEDGSVSGKTIYHYDTSPLHDKMHRPAQSVAYPLEEHYWDVGMLDSVVCYRREADGSYIPSSSTSYTYHEYQESERIYQGRLWPSALAVPVGFGGSDDYNFSPTAFHSSYSEFIHNCNSLAVGCMQTLSETRRTYENDGTVRTSTTVHEYNNPDTYFRPTSTTVTESDGSCVTVRSIYATDYSSASDIPAILSSKNIISKPLEQVQVRDGVVTYAVLNIYDADGDPVKSYSLNESGLPASDFRLSNNTAGGIEYSGTGTFNPEFSLYRLDAEAEYDNLKRLRELRVTGESPVCYLWGYNSIYPVAEIVNATRAQVDAIPNNTSVYPSDTVLRTFFATLRTNLPASLVSGYTYSLLIGITSTTDPSGRVVFYEYDLNGRLATVRDESGNLLNSYEYNLKNVK